MSAARHKPPAALPPAFNFVLRDPWAEVLGESVGVPLPVGNLNSNTLRIDQRTRV
jgi:hypothetical protein